MEPENDDFQMELPFLVTPFQVPAVNFRRCSEALRTDFYLQTKTPPPCGAAFGSWLACELTKSPKSMPKGPFFSLVSIRSWKDSSFFQEGCSFAPPKKMDQRKDTQQQSCCEVKWFQGYKLLRKLPFLKQGETKNHTILVQIPSRKLTSKPVTKKENWNIILKSVPF